MKKYKKLTSLVLAFTMIMSLAACGSGSGSSVSSPEAAETVSEAGSETAEENPEEGKTRIVTDHLGREVELPEEINRIVILSILPLPSVYCLFEGSAEKIVGIAPSSMAAAENSILPVVCPDILDVPTDFMQGGELNIEELIKLEPDVAFFNAGSDDELDKLEAAGIPAIGFSTSNWDYDCVATFEGWVNLLGEVLGQEDKAAGIVEYGYEVYDEIQTVLDEAGDYEKPKVMILFHYGAGERSTSGSNFFGEYWINSTGGINVASDLSGTPEINMEQVYEWDPDIIYITNFSPYQPEDLYENTIDGDDWSNVTAVKEKQVYKFPLGMYRWFPPASDTPLVLKWLATKNQPELFSYIDMEEEVRTYYKRFYDVELTDDQIYQIFNPSSDASGLSK